MKDSVTVDGWCDECNKPTYTQHVCEKCEESRDFWDDTLKNYWVSIKDLDNSLKGSNFYFRMRFNTNDIISPWIDSNIGLPVNWKKASDVCLDYFNYQGPTSHCPLSLYFEDGSWMIRHEFVPNKFLYTKDFRVYSVNIFPENLQQVGNFLDCLKDK